MVGITRVGPLMGDQVANIHVLQLDSSETDSIRSLRTPLRFPNLFVAGARLSTRSSVARMLAFVLAVTTKAAEQRQELNLHDALYSMSQQSEKVDLESKKIKTKEP